MIFVTGYKIAISPHSPDARSAHNTFPSTGLMTGPSQFWFELNQVVVYGLKHLILFFWHNIIMSWASFVPVFPLCSVETMIEMDDRSGHGRCHGCHVSMCPILLITSGTSLETMLKYWLWWPEIKQRDPLYTVIMITVSLFHLHTIAAIYWFTF